MRRMATVTRVVTVVEVDDGGGFVGSAPTTGEPVRAGAVPGWAPVDPAPRREDPRVMSLSALHLAVLDDGRRLTLLDDRGWTESGPADIWQHTSAEEIARYARVVVGPDEPVEGQSAEDAARDHWEHLAAVLRRQGVAAEGRELAALPHDVELGERLRSRLRV